MLNFLNERRLIILPIILIVIIIGGLVIVSLRRSSEETTIEQIVPQQEKVVPQDLKSVVGEIDIRNAFIKVADTVGPAVVSISAERTQKIKSPYQFRREGSPFRDEFFDRFFRDFFKDLPEEFERKQTGLGSGVIIDKDGYILTNEHVVSGAEKITVTLSDGRKLEAKVRGSDPRSDLAVVKIDAKNLHVASLGNSEYVQTGEWVVAIGNPFGYLVGSAKPTVTVGVVSALHRSLPSRKSGYLDLIQTDAAINPGNSGGPLCDLEGNVIGINVAIFSTTGGYQGIGFAIPINYAKEIVDDLIRGKKIVYGWMGVVIQDIDENLAKYFGLPDQKGVLIAQIVKNSPAHKAGLKEGDIIKEFDGKEVENVRNLIVNVSRLPVGRKIKFSVIRDKARLQFVIELGKMPSEEELAQLEGRTIEPEKEVSVQRWRGMDVLPITEDIARRFKVTDTEGVFIMQLEQGSPTYNANLRPRDIIKEINRSPIKTIEDYKKAIKDLKGDVLVRTDKGFTIVKEKK